MGEVTTQIARGPRDADWYFAFISIIFGVFIAVWIEPVTALFPYTDGDVTDAGASVTASTAASGFETTSIANFSGGFERLENRIMTKEVLIGVIMFVILVCLWWWYGTFLGNLSPANGFWLYFYDFVTLCSFAISFRLWYHPIVFPIIVVIAAALMLARFIGVLIVVKEVHVATRAQTALIVAIVVLATFVVFGLGMVLSPYFVASKGQYLKALIDNWTIYQRAVIWLLIVGILATLSAVLITEGRPFKFPRKPDDWKVKRWRTKPGIDDIVGATR